MSILINATTAIIEFLVFLYASGQINKSVFDSAIDDTLNNFINKVV